jgi:hypothetical protein
MTKFQSTTLHRANDSSSSLRTTVPISIIKQFNLNEGDKLSWKFSVRQNKLVIEVNPINYRRGIGNSIGNQGEGGQ